MLRKAPLSPSVGFRRAKGRTTKILRRAAGPQRIGKGSQLYGP